MLDGPCSPWAIDTSVCSTWSTLDQATKDFASATAGYVIWAATGRRFGTCPVTVRPCWSQREPLYLTYPSAYYWGLTGDSLVDLGIILSAGACGCSGACVCAPSEIALPGPVASIDSVKIDGVALAASAYRLDGALLVRQDGQRWPMTQDLSVAAGQPNTWEIAYQRGMTVSPMLLKLAGRYACELAKAYTGQDCALPARATSISRRGVDVQLINKDDFLDKGLTGIASIDQVINAINPGHLSSRPRVISPDLPQFR
jgi:hypothetical protein